MVILPGRRNGFCGLDPYTKLYLSFDGADGAQTTQDYSRSAHAVTFNGHAQLDTAQKVFGASSLLLDGTDDYLSLADHADWTFGTGNFTVDFWTRVGTLPVPGADKYVISQNADTNNFWFIYLNNTGGNYEWMALFKSGGNTKAYYRLSHALSADTWYHIALVRDGAAGYMFQGGSMVGMTEATAFGSNDVGDIGAELQIGNNLGGTAGLIGHLDEVRISKGIARWTTNFTPQTVPYR